MRAEKAHSVLLTALNCLSVPSIQDGKGIQCLIEKLMYIYHSAHSANVSFRALLNYLGAPVHHGDCPLNTMEFCEQQSSKRFDVQMRAARRPR